MDNQNNNNNNSNNHNHSFSMMSIMMVCCMLPILLFSVFGISLAGGQKWLFLGSVAIGIVVCLFFMSRSHGGHGDNSGGSDSNNSHKHGCC